MQIAIYLYPGFTALDAIGPYEILRGIPDSDIRFVSNERGPIVADSGVLIIGATHSLAETPTPDVILIPGSTAHTTVAMADNTLLKWLRKVHPQTNLTLSVCSGSLILAAAGLLKDRPATSHWLAQNMLAQLGAIPMREDRIVRSGKIITAAGVSAGIDLALRVVDDLCGQDVAESVQLRIEYDPQPHLDSGHPTKARPDILKQSKKDMRRAAITPNLISTIPKILWDQILQRTRSRLSNLPKK